MVLALRSDRTCRVLQGAWSYGQSWCGKLVWLNGKEIRDEWGWIPSLCNDNVVEGSVAFAEAGKTYLYNHGWTIFCRYGRGKYGVWRWRGLIGLRRIRFTSLLRHARMVNPPTWISDFENQNFSVFSIDFSPTYQ